MSGVATQVYAQGSHDNYETSLLPGGWVQATIGGVADLNPPKPPKDVLPPDAPVTFVPMPAVDAYSGTITVPEHRPFGAVRKGYTSFRDNDVIFAKITPCMENGKAAIARDLTNRLGFGSTEFHVLRSNGAAIPDYLFHYIRQESFRGAAEAAMTGSVGQKRVPVDFLKNALLPLPPLSEQKRIMAKVEQLLARVNAARERLAKVPEILKRFRQSVLAAACSGRLTADWRYEHSATDSAEGLLASVLADRRMARKAARRSKQSGNLQRLKQTRSVDRASFERLPDSWIWASGAQLFTWSSGKFLPKRSQKDGPYPIYGGNGITGYHTEYLVDHSTLVIGRVGALCGNVYITSARAWVTDNAIFATYVPARVNLPYMHMVFTRADLNANAGGSGQPFVNQTVLNEVQVPLPPPTEQEEIVRRVETMFKLADVVETRVAAATVQAEKLTQAILAKAFRGELVPIEAELAQREGREYEPASVLLERIKAEREALGKEERPKKRAEPRRRRHKTAAKETMTESKSVASADPAKALKKVSTDSDSSLHMTAASSAADKGAPAKQTEISIAVKKPKPRISQRPVALSDLETEKVMAAFRRVCKGRGAMNREELLREVSMILGYQRLGSSVGERLRGHFRAAIRRGIVEADGELVRPATRTVDDYSRDSLIETLHSVMRSGKLYDREEAIRAAAEHLGFSKVNDRIREAFLSAIRKGVRTGKIISDRDTIWRL